MRAFVSFFKKEWLEQLRTGKLVMLGAVFVLFGIMNPAIAKLTPWLLETLSDSLAQSGMTVTAYEVTAFDSWTQFFKNIPIALIVFVLAECGIFAKEYSGNTLVLCLTKGLSRRKVVFSKTATLAVLWSVLYFLCFGITLLYSAYFWNNSVLHALGFSVCGWWLLGILAVMLIPLFSAVFTANTAVAAGVGCVFGASYLLGFLPTVKRFVPTFIMKTAPLIYGQAGSEDYYAALVIIAMLCVASLTAAVLIFDKKQL